MPALPGPHIAPFGQTAAVTVAGMARYGPLTGREDLCPPGFLTVDIDAAGALGFH
ncbi:hypothetical protein [Streptomyces sp. IBSBF 2507]|uniref:hypothetical protein n=1 Tax=Streptomyces sp. IBSBF 2507 TaxID=2903530 RepID=UPI00351DE847